MINSLLFSSLYLANPHSRLLLSMICTTYKHDQTNLFFNISIPFNLGEQLINVPTYNQDLAQLPVPIVRKSKFLAVTDSPLNVDDRISSLFFDLSFAFNYRKMVDITKQQMVLGAIHESALYQLKTNLSYIPINYYYGYYSRYTKKCKLLNSFSYFLKFPKRMSKLFFVHYKKGAVFNKLRKLTPVFTNFYFTKHVYKHFGNYKFYNYLHTLNTIFDSRVLKQTRSLLERKLVKLLAPFMFNYFLYGVNKQLQINLPKTYASLSLSVLPLTNPLGNPLMFYLFSERLLVKSHPIFPIKIRTFFNNVKQKFYNRRVHFFSRHVARFSFFLLRSIFKFLIPNRWYVIPTYSNNVLKKTYSTIRSLIYPNASIKFTIPVWRPTHTIAPYPPTQRIPRQIRFKPTSSRFRLLPFQRIPFPLMNTFTKKHYLETLRKSSGLKYKTFFKFKRILNKKLSNLKIKSMKKNRSFPMRYKKINQMLLTFQNRQAMYYEPPKRSRETESEFLDLLKLTTKANSNYNRPPNFNVSNKYIRTIVKKPIYPVKLLNRPGEMFSRMWVKALMKTKQYSKAPKKFKSQTLKDLVKQQNDRKEEIKKDILALIKASKKKHFDLDKYRKENKKTDPTSDKTKKSKKEFFRNLSKVNKSLAESFNKKNHALQKKTYNTEKKAHSKVNR